MEGMYVKIGIVSDSHDHVNQLTRVMDVFRSARVDAIVHAGDFVAPFCCKILVKQGVPVYGVLGNNDGEVRGLQALLGNDVKKGARRIQLAGKKITIIHDIAKLALPQERAEHQTDIIIYGHTHVVDLSTKSDMRMVNPGECCGLLSGRATCAVMNVVTADVTIHTIA
jgi:putative phosphoesterase